MDAAWKKFVEPLQGQYDAIEAAFNSAFEQETKEKRQVAFEAALKAAQKFRDEHSPAKAPAKLHGKAQPVENDDGWQDKVRVEYKLPDPNSRDSHERSYVIDTLIEELDALVAQNLVAYNQQLSPEGEA